MILGFFRWWFSELAGLLPGSPGAGAGHGRWLEVRRSQGRVTATVSGGRGRVLLDAPEDDAAAIEAGLGAAIARLDPRRVQVRIEVPSERVLVRDVELPLAARENLREVLGFEMGRRTPFPAEAVHFDYRIEGQDTATQTLAVRLEVVPRVVLAPILAALAPWDPQPVSGAGSTGSGTWFAFRAAGFRDRPHARLNAMLAGLFLGLLAAMAWFPFAEQRAYRESLEREVDEARVAAAQAARLRDRLLAERDARGLILDARKGRPSMVELLEEVSQALPDGTYLFRFEVRGAEVNLHGSSDGASGLIAILEDSPSLGQVRFASPVTRDGATSRERFHIVASLGGEEES